MDFSKLLTLAQILLIACIAAYFINRKTTKVKQTTWFVRSPYWWEWYMPYPYTWQAYIIVCVFISGAVFIITSHILFRELLALLLLVLYLLVSYTMSKKKGSNKPNVSFPSTYNPKVSLFPQKSVLSFILDKLVLVIAAAVIFALAFGFCFLAQCRLP